MNKYWKQLNTHREYQDKVLSVDHKKYYFQKIDDSMDFTVVNTSDWVTIVPITVQEQFVLVKQFRVGTNDVTYEFPGGAININESKDKAAIRELREETGLESSELIYLGEVHPNPAFMSNHAYIYLAKNCHFKHQLNLDLFEDIEVVSVEKDELDKMILSGKIKHSIVLSAYMLYSLNLINCQL